MLLYYDPKLSDHFASFNCGPIHYAWPILRTIFTEVFKKSEWLVFMDFLIASWDRPDLLIYFTSYWLMYHRGRFLKTRTLDEVHEYVHQQGYTPVRQVMKKTLYMMDSNPCPGVLNFAAQIPIPDGSYPLFTAYPKVI